MVAIISMVFVMFLTEVVAGFAGVMLCSVMRRGSNALLELIGPLPAARVMAGILEELLELVFDTVTVTVEVA